MTYEKFAQRMRAFREQVDAEAQALKDSSLAIDSLIRMYKTFHEEDQQLAKLVLFEWAVSEDEGLRFDAVALIDALELRAAIPVLKSLYKQLQTSEHIGAKFELEKVRRIIGRLEPNVTKTPTS
ncbi:MAG: hypothetical protein ING75_18210 [Rhodocyclaceae bacterium]|nr:hypothetical protein [Rhodocyclaceae bacterium]